MQRLQEGQCEECPSKFRKKGPGYRVVLDGWTISHQMTLDWDGMPNWIDVCVRCYNRLYRHPQVMIISWGPKS